MAETNTVRETITIVPVTGAIYHNGQEKPTERSSFELGLNSSEDKILSTVLRRLEKGYVIKDKCTALSLQSSIFRLQRKTLHRYCPSGLKAGSFLSTVKNSRIIVSQRYLDFKRTCWHVNNILISVPRLHA